MFVFGLHSTSDDWPSNQAMKVDQNVQKDPLSHQKMKCLFLDYVQLLMITRAILAMKCDQNVKN